MIHGFERSEGLRGSSKLADSAWLRSLRRYMTFVAVANLIWEFAHLPLYTLWETGTLQEIVFAAVHCTGGDILISLASIMLALFLAGDHHWPYENDRRVLWLTVCFGLGYTIFSEWLNIVIREAWAYRDIMPIVPYLDAGLTPMLQWIVIPVVAYWWATLPCKAQYNLAASHA